MTTTLSPADLRVIQVLEDLPDSQLQWLLDHGEELRVTAGEILNRSGDEAQFMVFILTGTLHVTTTVDAETPSFIFETGRVTGLLPFSRMKTFPLNTRAATDLHALILHKSHFPELYQQIPELIPRLVGVLTDRVRESTKVVSQTDKLAAIGKLSAGLAHELNNPASAARQASGSALDLFKCYRDSLDRLAVICPSPQVYEEVRALEALAIERVRNAVPIDSLTRSDREEAILTWLESIGVEDAWHAAPSLVNAAFDATSLKQATCHWPAEVREYSLYRVAAAIEMEQVLSQIHSATSRLSDIVGAMKSYSFMDRASMAEIDINNNLETTLTLFGFRFKSGIRLETSYAADLPPVCGHGGQLNQVWTNLIDNALDAMEAAKSPNAQLTVRTSREGPNILVEISDNGPGIPAEIADKVFDPFFTTKPQGEGTGLGLDTTYRIVKQHQGDIRFKSSPSGTCFAIRLPVARRT